MKNSGHSRIATSSPESRLPLGALKLALLVFWFCILLAAISTQEFYWVVSYEATAYTIFFMALPTIFSFYFLCKGWYRGSMGLIIAGLVMVLYAEIPRIFELRARLRDARGFIDRIEMAKAKKGGPPQRFTRVRYRFKHPTTRSAIIGYRSYRDNSYSFYLIGPHDDYGYLYSSKSGFTFRDD